MTFANSKKIDNYFTENLCQASSFDEYISGISPLINDACQESCSFFRSTDSNYVSSNLYEPYTSFVKNAGKRSRPAITLLGANLLGAHPSSALAPALAIEHFHSAALIHDDIADKALTRRGMTCMHLEIGEGLAINCGDFGLNFMTGIMLNDKETPAEVRLRLIGELNQMAKLTIEGQALDIGWATSGIYDLTEDDYLIMAMSKTSHYSFATPLVCGAICAGAKNETLETLREFGIKIGLAFQIQDDILNLSSNSNETGKGECDDIKEGKRTLIVIHALNKASNKDRPVLTSILSAENNDVSDIDKALSIIKSTSSIEYASIFASKLIDEAVAILCENIEPSHTRDILVSMAKWSLTRSR